MLLGVNIHTNIHALTYIRTYTHIYIYIYIYYHTYLPAHLNHIGGDSKDDGSVNSGITDATASTLAKIIES